VLPIFRWLARQFFRADSLAAYVAGLTDIRVRSLPESWRARNGGQSLCQSSIVAAFQRTIMVATHSEKRLSVPNPRPAISIRPLESFDDLRKIEAVEREVWGLSSEDVMPLTMVIATQAAGSIWIGAFDGPDLVGFAFGFAGIEHGRMMIHSHMLAVLDQYRDLNLGFKLKLAQRERALAMGAKEMTWTFDPLQSKNAHFNFARLGVVSNDYRVDFYGPQTSSMLHQNGTDRLWVRWVLSSRRVQQRVQTREPRAEFLDILSRLQPLIRFNGDGRPARTDLTEALGRQRIAIEIPGDISSLEKKDMTLAREWRESTRWAFTEALKAGFIVAEFCRTVRGQQGPGAYLLEKGSMEEFLPEVG
jgi:predicted GNAT superfamily acetyltransferase